MPIGLAVEAREPDDQLLGEQRLELEERVLVDERVDHLVHVVGAPLLDRHDRRRSASRSAIGARGGDDRRGLRRHDVGRYDSQRCAASIASSSSAHEVVAAAADGRVHARAAHLLERHLLADHHLGHARRAEVHRGVALDHEHDVAERRDVRTARGRRAEQAAHLRHPAREPHLVGEDPARAAPTREQLDLVGDARAGGVDEVDDRQLVPQRGLGEPHDLLDGPRAPRARLHRRVVGHHAHRPAVDAADAGDHAVGGQVVGERVGEQPSSTNEPVVEQQLEPVADEQLVLPPRAWPRSFSRLPCERALGVLADLVRVAHDAVLRPWRCGARRACTWPGQLAADDVLREVRAVDQRVEVDAGVDPHVVEHVHEILGDDVAGRARRVRAAAEPADRRVEPTHAAVERRRRRWRGRCRACCGSAARRSRSAIADPVERVEQVVDARGVAMPVVSPNDSRSAPPSSRCAGDAAQPRSARRRLRTGSRTRSTRSPRPASPASCAIAVSTCAPSSDSATDRLHVLLVVRLARAHHDLELVGLGRDRALGALHVRHQRPVDDARARG